MPQGLIYLLAILALIAAGVLFFFLRMKRRRERKSNLSLNKTLQHLISQDQYEYYLIDVRSKTEYQKGHIPTAVNVPYGELGSFLPTDNLFINMVVYGRSPLQSARAAAILSDAGYFNVTSFGAVFKWRGPMDRSDRLEENKKKSS